MNTIAFINPTAVALVVLCTLLGLVLGSWVWGAIIGLTICLVATFAGDA